MKEHTARFYNWVLEKANSSKAPLWVALLFTLELFLFIPLDAVLIFFCLQDKKKTFLFVLLAAIASTVSGLIGYLIGHFLWDLLGPYIVPSLIPLSTFENLSQHLQSYESWAVFFGSLIPFPLKALSITAGAFQLGFFPFALFLFLARLLRFSLIGSAMVLWGEKVKNFVDKHFQKIFVAIGAKIAMALVLFWALASGS